MDSRGKQTLISFLVALGLGLLAFGLLFFLTHTYTLKSWSDSLFLGGAVVLAAPLFLLSVRSGAFDVFSYSFYRLGQSFRGDGESRFATAYDYQQFKKGERFKHPRVLWPFFLVSGLLLLSALILMFLALPQT
jgi:hypothetical protein